jgi:hypothetical protein
MTGFSVDWLTLREAADGRARHAGLNRQAISLLKNRDHELTIVDLGTGRGSNVRYLAPILGGIQFWQLVDVDEGLLRSAIIAIGEWAQKQGWSVNQDDKRIAIDAPKGRWTVTTELADLDQNLDHLRLDDADLVTASAFLDLVSESWVDRFAARVASSHPLCLFTLSYNGDLVFDPVDADDSWVADLLNQHQGTNKGFGAALGPRAAGYLKDAMANRGYEVVTGDSPWHLDDQSHAEEAELQRVLLSNWVIALKQWQPQHGSRLESWLDRRMAFLESGFSTLRIGHEDLLCWVDDETSLPH